jgi:phage terminase large subunit-like protein
MSAALRNLLLKTRKELSLAKAAMQDQIEQIRETALATLSDGDLRQLQGGRAGEAGLASGRPDQAAVARYRTACEAAAVRFTGRSCPALELSSDAVAQEIANRSGSKLRTMFPDEGPYRRELYPRHMEFLAAGATFRERLFMAGNRTGKTEAGAYELACHLTGQYPSWWQGKRFDQPINAWACGTTNGTTRDIVQEKLLGPEGAHGTGMIPARALVKVSNKQGLPNAVDTVLVKHALGGRSRVSFKSYESGRKAFEGTAQHVIWLDEESPLDIYIECLYRTATTGGVLYTTFTPLAGMSDVVKSFLEPENEEAAAVKHQTRCNWEEVPHLDAAAKEQLLASTPIYQRDARTKGIPQLGAGAIYPLAESDILVPRFDIPAHWRRSYGLDVGWNRTAAVWGAEDPQTKTYYLYHEYSQAQAEPVIHAAGIKAVGDWIPGVVDPACLGSSQIDGRTLMEMYGELGLHLQPAVNAVESGIYEVWDALSTGRLKVFDTLPNWLSEFRKHHRDEKGKIVKKDDHLMDAMRYWWVSGRDCLADSPAKADNDLTERLRRGGGMGGGGQGSWMT